MTPCECDAILKKSMPNEQNSQTPESTAPPPEMPAEESKPALPVDPAVAADPVTQATPAAEAKPVEPPAPESVPPIEKAPNATPPPASPDSALRAGSQTAAPGPRTFLQKALEAIQFRKRAKLEKIMALANKKGSVTNNDVEKLLRISDATATRYLRILVTENRLRSVGSGSLRRYEPTLGSIGGN